MPIKEIRMHPICDGTAVDFPFLWQTVDPCSKQRGQNSNYLILFDYHDIPIAWKITLFVPFTNGLQMQRRFPLPDNNQINFSCH